MTAYQVIDLLNKEVNPEEILIKRTKFGIISNNALGINHKDLKEMAKVIPEGDILMNYQPQYWVI